MIQRRAFMLTAGAATLTPARARADSLPLPPSLDALSPLAVAREDGAPITLGAALTPGPAVISFWATWCAPCILEARHLARMRSRFSVEALNIVGVNIDRQRDPARMAQFRERGRMNYVQLLGDFALYSAFNGGDAAVIALPRLFVFAADGRPTAAFGRYNGAATLRQIDNAVEAVVQR